MFPFLNKYLCFDTATIAKMGLDVTSVAASVVTSVAGGTNPVAGPSVNQNLGSTSIAVQAAAQQVLQNRVAEAQQATGVTLPSFYNPAAVNPMKYAQQIQKRKLLWSNKVHAWEASIACRNIIKFTNIITHRKKPNNLIRQQRKSGEQQPLLKTKMEK